MEALVDRVTEAFRAIMWRTIAREPRSLTEDREWAERVHAELVRQGLAKVALDPELHVYLAMTGSAAEGNANVVDFVRERAAPRRNGSSRAMRSQLPPQMTKERATLEMRAQVERLSPVARAVLILRRRDRLSFETIGQLLDLSVFSVRRIFIHALFLCAKNRHSD